MGSLRGVAAEMVSLSSSPNPIQTLSADIIYFAMRPKGSSGDLVVQGEDDEEHFEMIGYVTDVIYGIPSRCPPEDIYKIGKTAATEHYRAIFQIVKDHDKENNKRHKSEIEKYSISDQIEFLEEIMEKRVSCFNIVEEKDKIEVPYIDWDKLGEPFMSKPLVAPPPLS
ncbi:hypothetical protein HID58_047597, partial [Brassica napus]